MITFKEHKNIDKKKWDTCIQASDNNSIFVLSWYLDIVSPDWTALVLNDYEAVFPLASRSKYKINYLFQPFFSRYFGLYKKKNMPVSEMEFFKAIPDKFKYIEFCLHENSYFTEKGYQVKDRKFQILDLNLKYEKLRENYSDNAKRNIKKAAKKDFIIRKGVSGKAVVDLFKETKGGELELFKAKDYKTLIGLMDSCKNLNKAESLAVYEKEQLIAAAFFMIHDDRYVFLKSGVTDQGKAHGAMHLLMDMFIKEHAGENRKLDFGGSSVETVARFYKSFGAKDCLYLHVKINKLPRLVNWIKSLKS
jgi:hypothetical protein